MHTNTDFSDDEMDHNVKVIRRFPTSTQKIIDLILRKVEINLRNAAYKQCAEVKPRTPKVEAHSLQARAVVKHQ